MGVFSTGAHRRIRVAIAAVLMLWATGMVACGQVNENSSTPVVRLGALLPLTGGNAPVGQRMVKALTMAVNEAKRSRRRARPPGRTQCR